MKRDSFLRRMAIFIIMILVGSALLLPVYAEVKPRATQNPLVKFEPTKGEKELKFAVVTVFTGAAYWVPVKQGMKDAAMMLGVDAIHTGDPGFDLTAYINVLENLLETGIDGVSVFVPMPECLDRIIEKYLERGIPIMVNSTGPETAEKYGLGYVGQDNYDAGLVWGKKILELLQPDPAGKRIVFLTESPGQTSLESRIKGAREILIPEGVICDYIDTTRDRGDAYGIIESYYLANPDCLGLFSCDTTGSPVACKFIEKNNLIGKLYSGGFDLVPEVIEGIIKGSSTFTIEQYPYLQGFLPIMDLYLWVTLGLEPLDANTGGHLVTKENVLPVKELVELGYR
ncbi:MAG: substrate-binding domain-containing protein [Candidatus Aerophobetes bacterium]|nr:substrate-binding domain-containing protein [Candidatus Aerophobetes bacterium]